MFLKGECMKVCPYLCLTNAVCGEILFLTGALETIQRDRQCLLCVWVRLCYKILITNPLFLLQYLERPQCELCGQHWVHPSPPRRSEWTQVYQGFNSFSLFVHLIRSAFTDGGPIEMIQLLIWCLLKGYVSLIVWFVIFAFSFLPTLNHLQQGRGGAATKRGLDQHRRQQGLLPSPSGCMEGRWTYRQTAHSPRTFTSQTQRAGLKLPFSPCSLWFYFFSASSSSLCFLNTFTVLSADL